MFTRITYRSITGSRFLSINVAVVGSGPAGFYTAQKLLKNPKIKIDIYERLPVPFGLVRYGVAPDHSGVKKVINSFNNIANNERVEFYGNVAIGNDIDLKQLANAYHAVVLAYGSSKDRKLNIEGESCKNVVSARNFVGWYNGLPDERNLDLDFDCETACIIGHGNVALDCARILMKPQNLDKTDIAAHAQQALAKSRIKKVYVIGRRGPFQVSFTSKELRELINLNQVDIEPYTVFENYPKNLDDIQDIPRARRRLVELLIGISKRKVIQEDGCGIFLKFLSKPTKIVGDKISESVVRLELQKSYYENFESFMDPQARPQDSQQFESINCGLVIKSLGYEAILFDESLPKDLTNGSILNTNGRIEGHPNIYCSGWLATGATGVIAGTLNSSQVTANSILDDIDCDRLPNLEKEKPGFTDIQRILDSKSVQVVHFNDWLRIDQLERRVGEAKGKPREKLADISGMLEVARDKDGHHPVNRFTSRSHHCGQLTANDIGKQVVLVGWVNYTRFDNKIIILRDSYGSTQCVLDKSRNFERLKLYNESILRVSGSVKRRPEGHVNSQMSTGEIEVLIDKLDVLNSARKDLPILTRDENEPNWETRLRYRYLDIRSESMQQALRFRSKVNRILREHLYELGFVECETPTLYNRTPGGANEFLVPTQEPNRFYSLVQSPQQLKQLLMVGGLDRYFQICRCYRDETGRTDRQPEFTQLDLELSFTSQDCIMELVDSLIYDLLEQISPDQSLKSSFTNQKRIRRISYEESMNRYGTDKPDTRFGWLIQDLGDGRLFIDIPSVISKTELRDFLPMDIIDMFESKNFSLQYILENGLTKTRISTKQHDDESRVLLGKIRCLSAQRLEGKGEKVYNSQLEFIWVVEFPLLTVSEEGKLESIHHPFTAPTEDTRHLLEVNPLQVKGQHYDLVLNGQEIAGGSMRIHDASLQRQIFTDVLKVDEDTFSYFIEALESGCPPHGGIAFGLDRLVAILLDRASIKDVIAFPKSNSGSDLMTKCPQEISSEVKRMYHLQNKAS